MGFLVSEDLVEVSIDYVDLGKNDVLVVRNDKYKKLIEKNNIQLNTLKAKFSRPNWEKFNQYIKGALKEDPDTGQMVMDSNTLRQQKFRILLENIYEVRNDKEEEIILTEKLFRDIHPDLALNLVDAYDLKIQEEKNEAARKLGLFDLNREEEQKTEESEEEIEENKDKKE